jgi:CBS domain-containing protein
MKKLRDIMRPGFMTTVGRDATVLEASRAMAAHNVGIVAVIDDEQLVGLFSERDVVRRVVDRGLDPARTLVGAVMTTELVIADPDEDYRSAMRTMDEVNIRHLPVVSAGRLLSMLSIRDLMRVEIGDQVEELQHLHAYLYHPSPIPSPR